MQKVQSTNQPIKNELPESFGDVLIKKSHMIMKNKNPINDHYKIDKKNVLGSGSFGTVHRVQHKKTGQIRACKTIDKRQISNLERFADEITILKNLDHPNVIKLFEYFEDEKRVYLITELCTGGELFDTICAKEFLQEDESALIFKQILLAINYCHKMKIVHRDLKPENFLLQDMDTTDGVPLIKTIDFGLAKILNFNQQGKMGRMKSKVGTAYYMSPEVLAGNYDKSCDIWSAGCILYTMISGYPPFQGKDEDEIIKSVLKGKFTFDDDSWFSVSKEAKDLIKNMITKPEKRLTAEECLNHKWFKKQSKLFEKDAKHAFKDEKLTSFKSFMKTQKLQQAALTAIAVQASANDIKDLQNLFLSLDANKDGSISLEELKIGLGQRENGQTLYELLKAADLDNSGKIDYTEFIAATLDAKTYMKYDNLRCAFDVFDRDGSGKIDASEVFKILGEE